MRPVSTTLTFWILGVPFSILISAFFLVIYSYRVSLDASVILETISTVLSAVLVNLLVWERLRDSLSKRLKYLHKNYLFKLYSAFRHEEDIYFDIKDEIKRIRNDLGSYGRFIGIVSLYPCGLLNRIDEFLSLHGEFYERLQKIIALAKQLIGKSPLSTPLLWHFIGLKKQERLDEYAELIQLYEEKFQLIMKEQAQLVGEMKDFLEKTKKMRRQIFDKLEDFLKSNNLRFEPEPLRL